MAGADVKSIVMAGAGNIGTTGVDDNTIDASRPTEFAMNQNYPNPFNLSTTIGYEISEACHVILKVYDLRGKETTTLQDGIIEAGSHSVLFDGSDLTSGVYFSRITIRRANGEPIVQTTKMILLK